MIGIVKLQSNAVKLTTYAELARMKQCLYETNHHFTYHVSVIEDDGAYVQILDSDNIVLGWLSEFRQED